MDDELASIKEKNIFTTTSEIQKLLAVIENNIKRVALIVEPVNHSGNHSGQSMSAQEKLIRRNIMFARGKELNDIWATFQCEQNAYTAQLREKESKQEQHARESLSGSVSASSSASPIDSDDHLTSRQGAAT